MKHPDFKLYFAVMSHGRPENVLGAIQYLGTEATWFVGEGEAKAYRKAGAKNVVAGGSLPVSRNLALDAAWRKDLTCVQISDDLRRFSLATARLSPITALSASLLVKASLDARNGVYLGSGNSTSNPYMAIGLRTGTKLPAHLRPLISDNTLILGDFSIVKPCGLYFDEKTLVKEDYEYTLRHLRVFGQVLRCNYLLMDFKHRTNPGGANLNRKKFGAEKKAFDYLLERWPAVLGSVKKYGPTSSEYEVRINWRPKALSAAEGNLPDITPRFPRLKGD
jgi:hypothetical protein